MLSLLFVLSACQDHSEHKSSQKSVEVSSSTAALKQQLRNAGTPEFQYQLLGEINHPANNFTEGFLIDQEMIYESVGLYGSSKIRVMNIKDGKILREMNLAKQFFGEGIAIIGDKLFQLTYLERWMFVYNKNNFKLLQSYQYDSEGWGLTSDQHQLIMSNGTSTLAYINPQSLQITKRLHVVDKKHRAVSSLNELEFVKGKILANVWPTEIIVSISPQTGEIDGWFDISALKPAMSCLSHDDCVANGIAYHVDDNTLFVTGKNWPKIYVIKLIKDKK